MFSEMRTYQYFKYFLFFFICTFVQVSFAFEQNEKDLGRKPAATQVDEKKEAEIAQKVKNKIYPGGRDESQLKVQPALAKPIRKITPTVEESQESEADHD